MNERMFLKIQFRTHVTQIAEELPFIESLKSLEYNVQEKLTTSSFSSYFCSVELKQPDLKKSLSEVFEELFKCKPLLSKMGVDIDNDINLEFYMEHNGYLKLTITWKDLAKLKTFGVNKLSFSVNSILLNNSYSSSPDLYYYKILYSFKGNSMQREQIRMIWNKKFVTKYKENALWEEVDEQHIILWVKEDLTKYEWDEISNDILYMFRFLDARELHLPTIATATLSEYWYNQYCGELDSTCLENANNRKIDFHLEIDGNSKIVKGFPIG
jgi:hypothetical protein